MACAGKRLPRIATADHRFEPGFARALGREDMLVNTAGDGVKMLLRMAWLLQHTDGELAHEKSIWLP